VRISPRELCRSASVGGATGRGSKWLRRVSPRSPRDRHLPHPVMHGTAAAAGSVRNRIYYSCALCSGALARPGRRNGKMGVVFRWLAWLCLAGQLEHVTGPEEACQPILATPTVPRHSSYSLARAGCMLVLIYYALQLQKGCRCHITHLTLPSGDKRLATSWLDCTGRIRCFKSSTLTGRLDSDVGSGTGIGYHRIPVLFFIRTCVRGTCPNGDGYKADIFFLQDGDLSAIPN
jgi:hypothetical protein